MVLTEKAIALKLCECGCGRPAPIATKTDRRYGHRKRQPSRFIKGHKSGIVPFPCGHMPWNKGKNKETDGRLKSASQKLRLSTERLWKIQAYREPLEQPRKEDCSDNAGRRRAQRKYPSLGICQRCLIKEAKYRHHIDGNTRNNGNENIEFLCPGCHNKLHRH